MSGLKTRAVWLLAVAASTASAIGGYQAFNAPAPASAPPAATVAEPLPQLRTKTGELAFISSALRREIEALRPDETTGVFVHFTDAALPQRLALLQSHGLTVVNDYQPWADSVFATGTAKALFAIAAEPGVYFLEQNELLHYHNHTANWSIRSRVAQERVVDGPYYDANGDILDGKGIGVAVVDSGADGRHPDFQKALKRNYKVLAAGNPVDLGLTGSSDTSGGHGIHVAGTIMSDGSASTVNYPDAAGTPYIKGSFSGVAPGVSLYAYGCGEAISVALSTQAFQHILTNYDNRTTFPQAIRVINNSYGATGGTAYSATSTQAQLVKQLVAKGVTMVFSAGNSGDSTDADTTSPTCKDPTPGVICVASYDDLGTGSRDGVMSSFTSQGPFADPASYPDISAPGQDITSTCTAALPICKNSDPFVPADTAFLPYYGTISGTSMATPHTVGSIALLLQAKPSLTPPEVEKLLQDNARKIVDNVYGADHAAYRDDPQNPGTTTNYRAGAGLVDIPRMLDVLGVRKFGSLPADAETTVISGDINAADGADDGSQNANGANDFVKLTVQHEALEGVQGLRWRITVADAADLFGASTISYRITGNIDGRAFSTSGTLTEDGFKADGVGASTSAAATNVSQTGNVLSLFVPLASLGSPPIGAPVHNVRVVVTSDENGSSGEVDYAPSGDPTLGTSATEPGFGKPFTILRTSTPLVENRCLAPGLTVLNDAGGDSMTMDANQDLLTAGVAQPFAASGNPNLVFTIKASSLENLTASSAYFMSFMNPAGAVVGVRMSVTDPSAPTFSTYVAGASGGDPPRTDGRFVDSEAAAETGSNYDAATGTITIIAKPDALGLDTAPNATLAKRTLTGFNAGVVVDAVLLVNVTDEMPDGLGRAGTFEYKSNAACAPNTAPVALLTATPRAGTPTANSKPLTVDFNGTGSSDSDAGDRVASYRFNFGDGAAVLTNDSGVASHTYTRSGTFQVTLSVTDGRGATSVSPAMATVTVSNQAPTAALAADRSSGAPPLAVAFDATGSSDPNNGDGITLYSFDLDGDGSFEIVDSDSAKPSFTYNTAGSYVAKAKVKDGEGLESAVVTRTITVSSAAGPTAGNTAPTATLTATPTTGDASLVVQFDASGSSDPDAGDTLSYSYDLDGDGSFDAYTSNAKPRFVYNAPGSYAAKVKVKDQKGAESAVATQTITVTGSANTPPTARLSSDRISGPAPLAVQFDGSASSDPDSGDFVARLRFEFGDGTPAQDGINKLAYHTFTTPGQYVVNLRVQDSRGGISTAKTLTITVGAAAGAPTPGGPSTFVETSSGGGSLGLPLLAGLAALFGLRTRRRPR